MIEKYFNSREDLKKRSRIKKFDEEYDNALNDVRNRFKRHPNCFPIFIAITGSTSYDLDLEESDIDMKGLYIQDMDSILSELKIGQAKPHKYKSFLKDENDTDDIALYEIGRFLDMLKDNNPNILELLNTPKDCIVYEHPIWKDLLELISNEKVLTKKCFHTFYTYAKKQIYKATGLNKKINNPIAKERKSPIDFCHVIEEDGSKTRPLSLVLKENNMDQLFCGLVNVPNARDIYSLYYDDIAHSIFGKEIPLKIKKFKKKIRKMFFLNLGLGYKGILKEGHLRDIYLADGSKEKVNEYSNALRLSPIPKGENRKMLVSYNKDGYMKYCKDYTDFWGKEGWMVKRNEERYKDNTKSGQSYDGKNMSHCMRLLLMALEIAKNKEINVLRDGKDRDLLISIKKGEMLYDDILEMANLIVYGLESEKDNSSSVVDSFKKNYDLDIKPLKIAYDESDLIEQVDTEYMSMIVYNLRKRFYNLEK